MFPAQMFLASLILVLISGFHLGVHSAPVDDEQNLDKRHFHCSICQIKAILLGLKKDITLIKKVVIPPRRIGKSCADLSKRGHKTDGVYKVDPDGKGYFAVRCDMTTAGGGWTIFQRRLDGSVDFYRGWKDYKEGFGNLKGEFWLGLDKIHRLTKASRNSLRVDMGDTSGNTAYAQYNFFAVSSGRSKYQLSLGTYSGTAGDSLTYHKGMPFSTKDSDNDSWGKSCAVTYKGAWWYKSCHLSNLNGYYYLGKTKTYADGVVWKTWKGYHYSLKNSEMKIRPLVF